MTDLMSEIFASGLFAGIETALQSGRDVNLSNVQSGLEGFLALAVLNRLGKTVLYLAPSDRDALSISKKFIKADPKHVFYYPAEPAHAYFSDAVSRDIPYQRVDVLMHLFFGDDMMIVTTPEALLKKIKAPEQFAKSAVMLQKGDTVDPEALAERLVDMGYERLPEIDAKGQVARRGEIVDVFPPSSDTAYRLDFFDDEIESINALDIATQRSGEAKDMLRVLPVSEDTLTESERKEALSKIKERYDERGLYAELMAGLDVRSPEQDAILAAFCEVDSDFTGYLPKDTVIFWDNPAVGEQNAERFVEKSLEDYKKLIQSGYRFPEEMDRVLTFEALSEKLSPFAEIACSLFNAPPSKDQSALTIDLNAKDIENFAGRLPYFIAYVKRHLDDGHRVVMCCRSKKTMANMQSLFDEHHLRSPNLTLTYPEIISGFELADFGLVMINESDVFKPKRSTKVRRRKDTKRIDSFTTLKIGDYVVHDVHGIGIYRGISKLRVTGKTRDMMVIDYAGDDRLYIPIEQMNTISAYIGTGGDRKPKVNNLNRGDWQKTKAKAKAAAAEIAKDLVKLYAERSKTRGYAFGPDTEWQREFENDFPHIETEDQLRSIAEIKSDMERPQPMDRLLCGDVGYGKTEVAMRAAFKAVMAGKQVAMLAPTTILAEQHEKTFKARFAKYPVNIASISRFKSKKKQTEIVENLKKGAVDILIGTHRLLSKDIAFYDLGLLIVDEEQRFGVKDKEKLKTLRVNVDVLSLSATPIPRTLHMSMTGVRDMSVIEQAPIGRKPVETYVMRDNPIFLADAIRREMARGGQIYIVHNRINDILDVAAKFSRIVPEAKIKVAHGRMTGPYLEQVMNDFVSGNFDILLSTAIVESGLDVPRANTMIVNNADYMGLSQLYQIRGRVGRSDAQAYCYLIYNKNEEKLSPTARKRLKAIRDFTAFGAGFKVAMRDLEIRGAGNILGAEQSGHLINVGYEMYCRLLADAVNEASGGFTRKEKVPIKLNLDIDAFIPDRYIDSEMIKYEVYKKIARIADEKDLKNMREELTDRFGKIPLSVDYLLMLSLISQMAEDHDIAEISEKAGMLHLTFAKDADINLPDAPTIQKLYERHGLRLKGDEGQKRTWQIAKTGGSPGDDLRQIIGLLKAI